MKNEKTKKTTRRHQMIKVLIGIEIVIAILITIGILNLRKGWEEERNFFSMRAELVEAKGMERLQPQPTQEMVSLETPEPTIEPQPTQAPVETPEPTVQLTPEAAQEQETEPEICTDSDIDSDVDSDSDSDCADAGWTYMGEYLITAYCGCEECNGPWYGQPTASGTSMVEGRTIAVDPSIIPLGSTVMIDGNTYIAEDTGSGVVGEHIDMFIEDHDRGNEWGCQYRDVYLYIGE